MDAGIMSRAAELLKELPGKCLALHTFPDGGYRAAIQLAIKALEDMEELKAERDAYKLALGSVADIRNYRLDGTPVYVTSESIVDKEIALRMDAEAERDYWKARALEVNPDGL